MKKVKTGKETTQFNIKTETVSMAHDLLPPDVKISQLIREHSFNDKTANPSIESKDNFDFTNHDLLTGFTMPERILEQLEKSVQLTKNQPHKILTILYLNITGIKYVDNVYGHGISAETLAIITKRIGKVIRKHDQLLYTGRGKYLIIFMLEKDNLVITESIIKRITNAVSKPINING